MAEFEPAPLRSQIERERIDGTDVATIAFEGDVDLPAVEGFRNALSPDGLRDAEAAVVDLSGVRFMDSSGIHALLTSWTALRQAGTPLTVVVKPSSDVERVLRMTGVLDELAPVPDRGAAQEALAGKS